MYVTHRFGGPFPTIVNNYRFNYSYFTTLHVQIQHQAQKFIQL